MVSILEVVGSWIVGWSAMVSELTRDLNKMRNHFILIGDASLVVVPFGVTYEKIGTIQRRLAWPLHKDDTLSRSGRPTGLNIYASFCTDFEAFLGLADRA